MPTPVKNPREGPNILCTELLNEFLGLRPDVLRGIRSKIRSYPNPCEDAEDILHRAIIKALRRAETFRRGQDLSAWFFIIAMHSIVDHSRRGRPERRFSWLDSSAIEELVAHSDPSPEDILIAKDLEEKRIRVLRILLKRMPSQMGKMMKLRFAGCSDEEIAKKTGVSKVTVRTNIYRGIAKAKHLIQSRAA